MTSPHLRPALQNDFVSMLTRVITFTLTVCAGMLFLVLLFASVSPLRMMAVRTVLTLAGAAPPQDAAGHTNILLLGVGDANHDGADLTDTMMIASIDPATGSVVLLSIPRDLYLSGNKNLPDGRINTLYSLYKNQLRARNRKMPEEDVTRQALLEVSNEMSRKLSLQLHGVIKGDFTAFTDMVDALGGIDIDVPKAVIDYNYPLTEKTVGTFRVDKGLQHFDGETALKYARTRHSGTDFDRSLRQQQLIQALTDKVRSMNRFQQISFVSSALKIVVDHLDTTFTTRQLLGLTQIGTAVSADHVITMQINYNAGGDNANASAGGFVYAGDPALYEGANVLVPSVIPGNKTGWEQINTFVSFLIDHRELYLQEKPVQVVNVSANTLAAYRLQNELRRYGFTVTVPPKQKAQKGVPPPTPVAKSFITFVQGDDKRFAGFFGNLLNMNISQQSAETSGSGAAVKIVLGKDYKYVPFQTLIGE